MFKIVRKAEWERLVNKIANLEDGLFEANENIELLNARTLSSANKKHTFRFVEGKYEVPKVAHKFDRVYLAFANAGFEVTVHHEAHWAVTKHGKTIDYWPTKDKWRSRTNGGTPHFGYQDLINGYA